LKDFKLPDLGENIASGDIVQVLVKEGDIIRAEQPIAEIETDKAVVEVPSPFAGKVAKVHIQPGQKVKVGATLLSIDDGAAAAAAPATEAPAPADQAPPAAPAAEAPPKTEVLRPEPAAETPVPAPAAQPAPANKVSRPVGPPPQPKLSEGEPIPAGPATRRLARELGVDLRAVAEAYTDHRLTEDDVKRFVREGHSAAAAAPGAVAAPPLPDFAQWGPIERVPFSSLQRKTADLMSVSWLTSPHVTQFDEADVGSLEALRKRYQQMAAEKSKPIKLTLTVFIIKATTIALKEFPQFNSSLDLAAGQLVLKRYYHLGVAVDTPAGLIVPVLRDVDKKTILQIASELNDAAERTRARKIGLEELRGGTFTITNLGGIGGTAFTPIIAHPQVAILGVSRSREVPAIRDGQLTTKLMLPLSLSYDHRVINGADGARFVRRVAGLLEDPEVLLLEG
jgi:pyruvate dehydrogenase E2 component (dihydrolipoamide acetyltransferase)